MTLLEAVKTGRPFRRKGETGWYMIARGGRVVMQGNATYERYTRHVTRESDLEADDFEIEELIIPEWLL